MERIDRLIVKAQKLAQCKSERFTIGFVTYLPEPDLWEAQGNLTCGKPGRRQIITEHENKGDAISALETLSQKYPNAVEDAVIFIEDFEE